MSENAIKRNIKPEPKDTVTHIIIAKIINIALRHVRHVAKMSSINPKNIIKKVITQYSNVNRILLRFSMLLFLIIAFAYQNPVHCIVSVQYYK